MRKGKKLEIMDKILSKSKLTEQDALDIGREINKGIAKRHGLIKWTREKEKIEVAA